MGFALKLDDSLRVRQNQAPIEFANGDSLRAVLTRYLVAVEASADSDMLTSILLLDGDRLRHGAAPRLPSSYCSAIDNATIGPSAGSCGTAAYCGHPIYVTDIATDALWEDYRDIATKHGLRACWSTPISDDRGGVIGTFAIYHLTPRSPTRDEVKAIEKITDHVARAIMWSNSANGAADRRPAKTASVKPAMNIVNGNSTQEDNDDPRHQDVSRDLLRHIEHDFEALALIIERALEVIIVGDGDRERIDRLRRAKTAAERGAALSRQQLENSSRSDSEG
jgi:hypothetical protein